MPPALPRSSPSTEGVDPAGVAAFVDSLEAAPDIEPHSLMLLRHGKVVAERWWAPYAPERPHLLYSLSKSVTATALGLAVDEGLVSLDDTVLSHFPELDAEVTDVWSRGMLVRHIAAMASGHAPETVAEMAALAPADAVRSLLATRPAAEPGTVFAYSQRCTYTLARIVERVSGQALLDYLRPRLLDPLGIGEVGWLRDADGQVLGFSGLHARTEAVARLGQLYLQRGVWEGTRLLSEEWVEQATRVQVATPGEPEVDWRQGYGFQFWASRHGYRGDGAYGQFCVVLPEQDAVLAMTCETPDMQGVLDRAWEHLLPALGLTSPHAPAAGADRGLAQRLARLELPRVRGAARPPAGAAAVWDGFAGTTVGSGPLSAVSVAADGAGGWRVVLTGRGSVRVDVALGTAGWAESADPVPLATSGGWTREGTLRFDVVFLETPHRLEVACDPSAPSVTTCWRTAPLHESALEDLRSPALRGSGTPGSSR